MDPLLNLTDTAYFLRTTEHDVELLVKAGRIPSRTLGKHLRFLPKDLEAWLDGLPGVTVRQAIAAITPESETQTPVAEAAPETRRLAAAS